MVPVYAMLVFSGGEVQLNHEQGILKLSEWKAWFQVHPKIGVMIKMLRKEVENILAARIQRPEETFDAHPILEAVMALLQTDGF